MGKIITITYLLLLHTLLCMCLLTTEGTAQNTNRVNATSHGINEEIRIVCYFTNWAQYRPGLGKFWPEDINPKLCTHLIYAFAKIAGGVLAPYEWDDETTPWKRGLYDRFNDIKNTSKSIKTLLAVGGWNFGSPDFHLMVSSQTTIDKFISNATVFLRKWRFDGLDIDWEYPGARGSPAIDKERFSVLLMNLHKAFQKEAAQTGLPRLLLSAAVAAGKSNIDVAYQPQQMIKYLDFINLMGYDLHGSWETVTGINSPLYKRPGETGLQATLNQDWAVKYWLSKGVPPSMINLGMGMYGRTFTLKNATNHSIGAPVNGPGQAGEYTRERGFFSYYEICKHLKEGWTPVYEADQVASYAWKAYQWVGYDNVESVTKKAQYVLKQKLGGAMVWDTALDDFNGTFCGQGKYPLMSKINEILRPVMDTKPTNESQTENISKKHSFGGRTLNQNVQFEEQRILTSRTASDAKDSKMLESNAIQEDFLQRKFTFKNTVNMKKDLIVKKPNIEKRIVCYFPNWGQYTNTPETFLPEDINATLCTHLIFAFARIEDGVLAKYEWNDPDLYRRLNNIKNTTPSIKTLLAVGGSNLKWEFSKMVSSQDNIDKFVSHAIDYLQKWKFDGLDIAWLYPATSPSPPGDREKFTQLLKSLRTSFDHEQERLLLSADVASLESTINAAYEPKEIIKYVDFLNLLTYDFHGYWQPYTTGLNSPLYARPGETGDEAKLNQNWVVKFWTEKGVPASKLNLGIAMYGRTFTLGETSDHSVGAPAAGPGNAGEFTKHPGILSYYEICKRLSEGWKSKFEDHQMAPYAWKDNQWVGYDDLISVQRKAQFVQHEDLGGVMIWSMALDDFKATLCGEGSYPLLTKINNVLRPNWNKKQIQKKTSTKIIST